MPRPELFFLAGQSIPRCTHQIDKHFTAYQTFQFMEAGEVSLTIGRKTYALNGRWFWSGFPGPRIKFNPATVGQTWVHRYIAFQGPLVKRWIDDGLFPVMPLAVAAGDFAARFDALLHLIQEPGRPAAARAALALEALLLDLSQAPTALPPTWVDKVQRELAKPEAPADYENLAGQVGLSVRSLRRHFRTQTGTSPHQYAIGRRVATARDLLLSTNLPVKEIARRLGYADVFYFGRQFKRQTGVSPALFRKSREG
jgi:AraC family transcriptional regulator of arabinose operon